MKYYLLKPDGFLTGPFELADIEAQFEAGDISPDTQAAADTGESLAQIRNTPAEGWMSVQSIPGFGQERPPETVSLATADAIRFCPGCAHQLPKPLPPGEAGVCERCGRTLGFAPPPPLPSVKLLPVGGSKSGGVLASVGKALGTVFIFLLCLMGGLLLLAFLLFILLLSQCRA